ncbi:MAG TPA: methyltransferase domain-containing protein [Candidatus Binataceae bacterium]|nr:methyltransferase domain-containing protein [Candidatus Binataceae bacterium]
MKRWSDLENFDPLWAERAKAMAQLIPPQARVIEFGAGRRELESNLDRGCSYVAADLVDRGPGTIVLDLEVRPLPDLSAYNFDIAVFGGVLEYLSDVAGVISWLAHQVPVCLASYECAGSAPGSLQRLLEIWRRASYGWVSTYTETELRDVFATGGFRCSAKNIAKTSDGNISIFRFDRIGAPP